MNTKVYLVTEWVVSPQANDAQPSFVVGVFSSLQLAQDRLRDAMVELMEANADKGPFSPLQDAEDVCLVDNQQTQYHYNIIERTLDE